MRVGLGGVVLNDVAGQCDEIRRKVALAVVGEYRLQRVVRYGATKSAELVGEKMRVRQVQDPHGIS